MPEETTEEEGGTGHPALYESLEQAWVQIQLSTFTNWINQNLGKVDRQVDDLVSGLSDGVTLVYLVEVLQDRKLPGARRKVANQHQRLDNVDLALKALAEDKVRLVNIGGEDIVNQNVKLMMGLVWSLIKAYHIGKSSRAPPKRLMLTWLQNVLPEANITNFSTDWNDGRTLLGLLDFFKPGLCPVWKELDPKDSLNNCQRGLRLAEDVFGVPPVLSAEDLNNPNLDELSCLTYLSYLMNDGSPGYKTTMAWVNQQMPQDRPVKDFTESWRDGRSLCELVSSAGGNVKDWPEEGPNTGSPLERTQNALTAAEEIGVKPLFTPRDMLHRDLDHLTVMAYCAKLKHNNETRAKQSLVNGRSEKTPVTNGEPKIDRKVVNNNESVKQVKQPIQRSNFPRKGPRVWPPPKNQIIPEEDEDGLQEVIQSPPQTPSKLSSNHKLPPRHTEVHEEVISVQKISTVHSEVPTSPGNLSVVTQKPLVEEEVHLQLALNSPIPDKSRLSASIRGPDNYQPPVSITWAPNQREARIIFTPSLRGNYRFFLTGAGSETDKVVSKIANCPVDIPVLAPPPSPPPIEETMDEFVINPVHTAPVYSSSAQMQFEQEETYAMDTLHSSSGHGSVSCPADLWLASEPLLNRPCVAVVDLTGYPALPGHDLAGGGVRACVTREGRGGTREEIPVTVDRRDMQGKQRITFITDLPGEYKIEAFVGEAEILGSPFFFTVAAEDPTTMTSPAGGRKAATVYASGECLTTGLAPVNMPANLGIHGDRLTVARIQATVTQFSNGRQINAHLRDQSKNSCSVDFHPKEIGDYEVRIKCDNTELPNSPFLIHVFDPKSIQVDYDQEVIAGQETQIFVNSGRAGEVEVRVQPPTSPHPSTSSHGNNNNTISSAIYPRHDTSHKTVGGCLVHKYTYVPQVLGRYTIHAVTVGGLELAGPMVQTARAPSVPLVASGSGLQRAEIGQPAAFVVDPHGEKGDLFVQVDGPNSIAKCDIQPETRGPPGRYRVDYIPNEPGLYTIRIKWNQREISGSPFNAKVVAPKQLHCVSDEGLFRGERLTLYVNQTKELVFDTREAGPGTLRAEVRGPWQLEVVRCQVESSGMPHESLLRFTPVHEGEHRVQLWWENFPVSSLPFYGVALSPSANVDHNKVILSGRGLREACIDEEAEFVIDGRQAGPGQPHVTLAGVKVNLDVKVSRVSGERYRCAYTPKIPGAYLLTIMWSDLHVRGSPFKVNVLNQSDAGRVVCSGEGLVRGIIGRDIQCEIDTKRAGPGELTAHCTGPNKVAYCELNDHRDGTFTLKLNPQEPGRHRLQIRYNGKHVQGSPFSPRISGSPDATKVSVCGPGIESGILSTFQSRFICETRGAGAGQLTVRIKGRQGAFRVEMERETQKDRTIVCRYDPTETGEYLIHVKWSGVHVSGSPFQVHIFETAQQLGAFYRANPENVPEKSKRNDWKAEL